MDAQKSPTEPFDKDTVRRLDSVTEDDIYRGFRTRALPDDVRKALKGEGLAAGSDWIRLSRVNPSRRRKMNEEIQRRYHRDLGNPDVLSDAQVLEHVKRRGEWTDAMKSRMEELHKQTTQQMAALWGEGMLPQDSTWSSDLVLLSDKFHAVVAASGKTEAEKLEVSEAFDRWQLWTPQRVKDGEYPADYNQTEQQGRLFDLAPGVESIDLINEIEELKDKQERRVTLIEDRSELAELQLRHARIFSDTAESRRDHTEEMAQLYFTCAWSDELGTPKGALTPTFELLWDYPEAAIRWLLYESFFFHNDIPDGAKEYLAAFGFLKVARANSENDPSVGSPAPLSSGLDGAPAEATPAVSGESLAPTT